MDVKELYKRYVHLVLYLFFGVCTTLVNVVIYWGIAHILNWGIMVSTMLAWICAVLFAYITNRKWVFASRVTGVEKVFREILTFFLCRLTTGVIDWAGMYIFAELIGWNDVIVKFCSNIIVIILNYIASKLIIFKTRKK